MPAATDVDHGEDGVDAADHQHARHRPGEDRGCGREGVDHQVGHRRARHDVVRCPAKRAGDAADDRAERRAGVGVETAMAGHAAADLGEAEPDQPHQDRDEEVAEQGLRAEQAGHEPGQARDAGADDLVEREEGQAADADHAPKGRRGGGAPLPGSVPCAPCGCPVAAPAAPALACKGRITAKPDGPEWAPARKASTAQARAARAARSFAFCATRAAMRAGPLLWKSSASFAPIGEPMPVHASGPARARYWPLSPWVMSLKARWFSQRISLIQPSFRPKDAKSPA